MSKGISYFPLDCQLDDKFGLIEAEYGLKGFAVVVKLFQKIYGEQGYYCEWSAEVELLFSRKNGFPAGDNSVSEIVRSSIRRGIFSEEMFEKYRILTSKGIQERYFKITQRRQKIKVEPAYLLIDVIQNYKNVDIIEGNVCRKQKNVDNSQQSKVKESKGNRERATPASFAKPTQEEIKAYCLERGLSVSPEKFYLYYESKGWKVGRSKMADWRAKIEEWEVVDKKKKTATKKSKHKLTNSHDYDFDALEDKWLGRENNDE